MKLARNLARSVRSAILQRSYNDKRSIVTTSGIVQRMKVHTKDGQHSTSINLATVAAHSAGNSEASKFQFCTENHFLYEHRKLVDYIGCWESNLMLELEPRANNFLMKARRTGNVTKVS